MRRPLIVLACLSGLACGHTGSHSHPKTVEDLYNAAVEDMDNGAYPEALKEFSDIKVKYPYSRFAALSDLRTADTHYKRGKYIEAVDAYRNFLKFHPNHDEASYALFRIGEAYYAQLPSDYWFLPPSAEKDQSSTRQAIAAYQDLLSRYGKGTAADEAKIHLDACRRKLADHEMYVARFYFRGEHYPAAASRAEGILKDYAGLGLDPDALWIVGRSRYATGEKVAAAEALQRLVQEFPAYSTVPEAKIILQTLGSGVDPKS